MDLDERAARAAADLRRRVVPDLDLDAARTAVGTGARHRRSRRLLLTTAATVLVAVGLVAALVGLAGRDAAFDGDVTTGGERELSAAGAAIIDGLPRSPIDGKASWRLPVVAQPQSGVAEGDVVTVYGRGFQANDSVGVVMCTSEAEVAGVAACQLGEGYEFVTYASADEEGIVVADVVVRQRITTPETGEVDCRSAAERCLIAIGAVNDYDRSGGSYVNFAGAPEFPVPTVAVDPAGPYVPGQAVQVTARDLLPGRSVQVQQCLEDLCAVLARGQVAADGTYTPNVAVNSVVPVDGQDLPCDDRCTLVVSGIGPPGASKAPQPDPIALRFVPGLPPASTTTTAPPDAGGPPPEVIPLPPGDTTASTAPTASTSTVPAVTGPTTTATTSTVPAVTGPATTATTSTVPG